MRKALGIFVLIIFSMIVVSVLLILLKGSLSGDEIRSLLTLFLVEAGLVVLYFLSPQNSNSNEK